MKKYEIISAKAFSQLQLGAGVLVSSFNPEDKTISQNAIIGATNGGISCSCVPTFVDHAEGLDNVPVNTKELKEIDGYTATMSGTFRTVTGALAKRLLAAATISGNKITPSMILNDSDFSDIWWVGDYSDVNSGDHAGFIAIHLLNALSTGGFTIQSANKDKGSFAFTFTGHSTLSDTSLVPFEIYIEEGYEMYTVTYNSNGGTGTMTDTGSPYADGSTVTVMSNTFTKSGSTFSKWATNADGSGFEYDPADQFIIAADTVLYAQWTENT